MTTNITIHAVVVISVAVVVVVVVAVFVAAAVVVVAVIVFISCFPLYPRPMIAFQRKYGINNYSNYCTFATTNPIVAATAAS